MEVRNGIPETIERKVRTILAKNEDARNDDMVLYLVLCNACLKDAGALPLAEIMTQYKYLGFPSFESVSRTRRKLQARYPELAGSRPVRKKTERRRTRLPQIRQRIRSCLWRKKKRINGGYEIMESCTIGNNELVIGHNAKAPNRMCVGIARTDRIISGDITAISYPKQGKS